MSHKILVVDDSPTQRLFVSELLQEKGYQVITADDGGQGYEKARIERPDLILMDVVMPGTSGFQATRNLNRDPATREIPVIFCTSKSAETDRIWGLRQGARDYLLKPIQPDELLARIAEILN